MHKTVNNQSLSSDTSETDVDASLSELEKVSWEEKRVDEQVMDTDILNKSEDKPEHNNEDNVMEMDDPTIEESVNSELHERSKFRDQQIKYKEQEREDLETFLQG